MATSKEIRIENLRALVKEFGTAEAVARLVATSPAYLSQILNGAPSSTGTPRGIGDALARKLEQGCGKDPGWLDWPHSAGEERRFTLEEIQQLFPGARAVSSVEGDPDFYLIPKVHLQLSAGVTGFQTVPEIYDGDKVSVPKGWVDRNKLSPKHLIAVTVKGESMEPVLYERDVVIIDTSNREMTDGAVCAVNYEGEAVIKRLTRDVGQWWLSSDNPDQRRYQRKNCRDGECIIVGRVVRRETDRI